MRVHLSATRSLISLLGTFLVLACGGSVSLPVAVAGNDQTVNTGAFVQLDASASSDPQNRLITFLWTFESRPLGSQAQLVDPESAQASFLADMPGDYVLRVTVSNSLRQGEATVKVTASACGSRAPVVSDITTSTGNPSIGSAVQLAAVVSDPDNGAGCNLNQSLSFQWTMLELPAGSRATLNSVTSQTPNFTPDVAGNYVARLVVTDSTGRSSVPKDFTIAVSNCGNNPPSIVNARGTPALPSLGTTVTLSVVATDVDNDPAGCNLGETISFAWTPSSAPSGSQAQLSNPTSPSPTLTVDLAGTYTFTVVATDSRGLSSEPAGVVVQTATCAPQIAAFSPNPASAIIGNAKALTAPAVTDNCVASPVIAFQWRLVSRPAGSNATLSGSTTATAMFTPDLIGDYQAELLARDQGGFTSAPESVTVGAATCGTAAPALSNLAFSPTVVNTGDRVAFSVGVADANSACGTVPITPFHFSWSLVSRPAGSGASLSLATSASPLLTPDVVGSYQVSVVVADALGNVSAQAFVTLTTTQCGQFAPTVNISPGSPIATNSNRAVALTATATSSDNDPTACPARFNDTFSFAWSIVSPSPASRLSLDSGPTTNFTASQPAAYTVKAIATASNGTSSAAAFASINVATCGSAAPVIVATSNSPAFPAPTQDVTLSASATDDDASCGITDSIAFTWSVFSLPQGSHAVLLNPTGAAHFFPDIDGTYRFSVVATDSTGLSSAPAFVNITAAPPDPGTSTIGLTLNPSLVVANGVDNVAVTSTIRNRFGNPIAALPVRVDVSGSTNVLTPGATGITDVNGVFQTKLTTTKAQTKTITVTASPGPAEVVLNTRPTVTFVPEVSFAVNRTMVLADGLTTTTVTVQATDGSGPTAGVQVTVAATGSNNTFAPALPTGATGPDGRFVVQLASTTAEVKSVSATASFEGIVLPVPGSPASVTFVAVPVVTVATDRATVLADGTAKATLTVTALTGPSPTAGVAVNLAVDGTGNVGLPVSGTTGADGTFKATLASTTAESKHVTATATLAFGGVTVAGSPLTITLVNSWLSVNNLSGATLQTSTLNVVSLVVDPTLTNSVYASAFGSGILHTTAGDQPWTLFNGGLGGPFTFAGIAVAANGTGGPTLYIVADCGSVFTSVSGANWSAVPTVPAPGTPTCPDVTTGIVTDSADVTGKTVYASFETSGVWKSIDGGATWTTFSATGTTAIAIASGVLFAGSAGGALTRNAGAPTTVASGTRITAIAANSDATIVLAGLATGAIFRSGNGGGTFGPTPVFTLSGQVNALVFDPTTNVYASESTGVRAWKSIDSGQNFSAANVGLPANAVNAFAVDATVPATVYAGTNGAGFFKSTRGGQ